MHVTNSILIFFQKECRFLFKDYRICAYINLFSCFFFSNLMNWLMCGVEHLQSPNGFILKYHTYTRTDKQALVS